MKAKTLSEKREAVQDLERSIDIIQAPDSLRAKEESLEDLQSQVQKEVIKVKANTTGKTKQKQRKTSTTHDKMELDS